MRQSTLLRPTVELYILGLFEQRVAPLNLIRLISYLGRSHNELISHTKNIGQVSDLIKGLKAHSLPSFPFSLPSDAIGVLRRERYGRNIHDCMSETSQL
jgi:hypothetical protein